MRAPPRVSVIIPAYGLAALLPEALDSLLAQHFTDWEAVVIDDGSPDDVAGAVAPYLADPRFRFVATANQGVSAARNRAIAESRGSLIVLLDADDRLLPDYLDRMTAPLIADEEVILTCCDALFFGSGPRVGRPFSRYHPQQGPVTLERVIDRRFNIYIGACFRRSAFDAICGFDDSLTVSEDYDLWLRLIATGGRAVYIPEILAEYRRRQGSLSGNHIRILEHDLRVYDKLAAMLGDRREGAHARAAHAHAERELAWERAIDEILRRDRDRGLSALRAARVEERSLPWRMAMALMRMAPPIARPLLEYRRRLHELA